MSHYRPSISKKRSGKNSLNIPHYNTASAFNTANNTTTHADDDFVPYDDFESDVTQSEKRFKYDDIVDVNSANIYDYHPKQTQSQTLTNPICFSTSCSPTSCSRGASSSSGSTLHEEMKAFGGLNRQQKKQVRDSLAKDKRRESGEMGETRPGRDRRGRESAEMGVRYDALKEAENSLREAEKIAAAVNEAEQEASRSWEMFSQMTSLIGGDFAKRDEMKKLYMVLRTATSRVAGRLLSRHAGLGSLALQFDCTNFRVIEPVCIDAAHGGVRNSCSMARNAPLQTTVLDYVYPLKNEELSHVNHNLIPVDHKWGRIPIPMPMQNLQRCKEHVPAGQGCPLPIKGDDDEEEEVDSRRVKLDEEVGWVGGELARAQANWAGFCGVMGVVLDCVRELWEEANKTTNANSNPNSNSDNCPLVIHVVSDYCNTQRLSLFWLIEQFNKYNTIMVVDACKAHFLSTGVSTLASHLCAFQPGYSTGDLETALWSEGALNKYRYSEVCELTKKSIPGKISVKTHLSMDVLSERDSEALEDWVFFCGRAARAWSGPEHKTWLAQLRRVVFLGREAKEVGEGGVKTLHVHLGEEDTADGPTEEERQRRAEAKARYVIFGFSARYYFYSKIKIEFTCFFSPWTIVDFEVEIVILIMIQ